MQHPVLEKNLHHLGDPSGPVEIRGDEPSPGLEVAEDRNPFAQGLEVVDRERNPGRVGDGEQMKDGVGRPPHRHGHGDGIFEGLAGQDMPGKDLFFDRPHQNLRGSLRALAGLRIFRGHGGREGEAHAHGLDGRGHGIRGIHPPAGSGSGAGAALDLEKLLPVDPARAVFADSLERAHDGEVAVLVAAWLDRASVDEDGRNVEARHGDQRPRHVLVAAPEGQHAVHALAVCDGFNGIGNHFTRDQGVFHPLGSHRNSIGNGNGSEALRHGPGSPEPLFGHPGEGPDPHVAGSDRAVGVGHAHDGLFEIPVPESRGAQKGPIGRPFHPLRHLPASDIVGHTGSS